MTDQPPVPTDPWTEACRDSCECGRKKAVPTDDLSALEQANQMVSQGGRSLLLTCDVDALIARTRQAEAERDDYWSVIVHRGNEVDDLRREVERLRELRDEIALQATVGLNTQSTAWKACAKIVELAATEPPHA